MRYKTTTVYAKQGARHDNEQKIVTGMILASSSIYLITSLFAVTSAQIGLISSEFDYTHYSEEFLAHMFGNEESFEIMKSVSSPQYIVFLKLYCWVYITNKIQLDNDCL